VLGAVQVFPSRPPTSKPVVTVCALAAASPKAAAQVDHSEAEECDHCLSDTEAQTVEVITDLEFKSETPRRTHCKQLRLIA